MDKPKEIRNKNAERIFTYLVRMSMLPNFSFPKGGIATRAVTSCMDELEKRNGTALSMERLIDFCVCQAYCASQFDGSYFEYKWKANHSFGKKAIERFQNSKVVVRYYEDKWLTSRGLSRHGLTLLFGDKSKHPLHVFIFPEYEEATKMRMHSSEVGYYICQIATLLWTPFSPACCKCKYQSRCRDVTQRKYAELYRIRVEEYQNSEKE